MSQKIQHGVMVDGRFYVLAMGDVELATGVGNALPGFSGTVAPTMREVARAAIVQHVKRRRRTVKTRKLYVPILGKRGKVPAPELNAGYSVIWECVLANSGGLTARAIEQKTGSKQKQVESALWYLRSIGVVKSVTPAK